MARSLLLFIAILTLLSPGLSQEIPIEIELVVPPDSNQVVEIAKSTKIHPKSLEPKWAPPTYPCSVCKAFPKKGHCRCDDPLTQDMAHEILRNVSSAITESTASQIILLRPVTVRAAPRGKLSQMGGERLLGLYEDDVIWVNQDLNRLQATAVIAHEYGHAWFFQRRSDVETPNELLFEGFAEFVSYLALRQLGDKSGANKIEYQDQSVYGRGARKLIAVYRRAGVEAVVRLALTGARV